MTLRAPEIRQNSRSALRLERSNTANFDRFWESEIPYLQISETPIYFMSRYARLFRAGKDLFPGPEWKRGSAFGVQYVA
ncbi:MAG: hypothetical protein BRD55_02925 [Bacteroidetes bacterium SW_9_63_38]|nr:MAG: hypothetical protein BRD55_02925 [Bacteroidetes bacterium SW_9_63_38]